MDAKKVQCVVRVSSIVGVVALSQVLGGLALAAYSVDGDPGEWVDRPVRA